MKLPRRKQVILLNKLTGIKALAFKSINASPLDYNRNICRAEWKFFSLVKKMALSEQSEFGIFRDKRIGMKEPDSLSGSKPLRDLALNADTPVAKA